MLLLTTPPLSPPSRAATPRSPHRGRQVRSLRSDEKCETRVYNNVIEKIGTATDAAGVAVIVAGGLIAFGLAAVHLSRGDPDVYRRFRQRLGQTILLGLEL